MNVLFSSAGRRVGLMACFRDALYGLGLSGKLIAADASLTSPAGHAADTYIQVCRCSEPSFIEDMLQICVDEEVKLLIPTIDTELALYASARNLFAEIGTVVAISDSSTVAICRNKTLTNAWLVDNGFPTVRQCTIQQLLDRPEEWKLPLITKPRDGSASKDVATIRSHSELQAICNKTNLIVEEIAAGEEYTVNVYVNRQGRCVCAVPHQRIEVRAGEVSKGITVKNPDLMRLATDIAERLPGAYGPLNIQCFVDSGNDMRVIEINARFGGGYPLADRAGARYAEWLLMEALQRPVSDRFDQWEDRLMMLRYDNAVYVPAKAPKTNVASIVSGI
jgi:carbamoyl-phosphate synthase large subunit